MSRPTEMQPVGHSGRCVFFVSDGTGVTVETLGHSLLSQFETLPFRHVIIPFVNSEQKAHDAVARINADAASSGLKPIVFCSLVDERLRRIVEGSVALTLDFFSAFLSRLESELGTPSSHALGRAHGVHDSASYLLRIEAVNYALATDDGLNTHRYSQAQVILTGLSRVGKTPTCLYLALQCGIFAANYPITEEELDERRLPRAIAGFRDRLYGLTVAPAQLTRIRAERRPDSPYSAADRVRRETRAAEELLRAEKVPMLDTTAMSVEEIAANILYHFGLTPHLP